MKFQGATYSEPHDGARLSSQLWRVKLCLQSGSWWTLEEIKAHCGGSLPGISARLRDLRKPQFGSYIVERRRRGDPKRGLFEYRLLPPVVGAQQELRL